MLQKSVNFLKQNPSYILLSLTLLLVSFLSFVKVSEGIIFKNHITDMESVLAKVEKSTLENRKVLQENNRILKENKKILAEILESVKAIDFKPEFQLQVKSSVSTTDNYHNDYYGD